MAYINVLSVTDTEIGRCVKNVVLSEGDTIVERKNCVWDPDDQDDLIETFEAWVKAAEDGTEGFAIL